MADPPFSECGMLAISAWRIGTVHELPSGHTSSAPSCEDPVSGGPFFEASAAVSYPLPGELERYQAERRQLDRLTRRRPRWHAHRTFRLFLPSLMAEQRGSDVSDG